MKNVRSILNLDERATTIAQPSRKGQALGYALDGALLTAGAFGIPASFLVSPELPPFIAPAIGIAAGVTAAFGLADMVRREFTQFTTEYVITNQRVLKVRDFLGRTVQPIPLDQITEVSIDQSLSDRLAATGTVQINTSNGSGFSLEHVSNPYQLAKALKDSPIKKGVPPAASKKESIQSIKNLIDRVSNLLERRQYKEALRESAALQELAPTDITGIHLTGLAYERRGDFELAEKEYQRVAKAANTFTTKRAVTRVQKRLAENSRYVPQIMERRDNGDYAGALKDCARLLKKTPDNFRALYLQGTVFEKQGKIAEAARCYSRVLGFREYERAKTRLESILKTIPEKVKELRDNKQYDKALEHCAAWREIEPKSHEARYFTATVHERMDQLQEAVGFYQSALEIRRGPSALRGLQRVLAKMT